MFELKLEILDHGGVAPARCFDARQQQWADAVVAARNISPAEHDEPHVSLWSSAKFLRPRLTSAPLGVDQIDLQRHLADGMGGAGQAGIIGADRHFDMVQQALR